VSEVVIRTKAGDVTSIITTGSVERMNLKEGDAVFAVVKATEVSVEKGSSLAVSARLDDPYLRTSLCIHRLCCQSLQRLGFEVAHLPRLHLIE